MVGMEKLKDHAESLYLLYVCLSPWSFNELSIDLMVPRCFFSIKIHDLSDLKEMTAIINLDDERSLDRMEWTDDGQLLAVTSTKGNLYVYLTSLPLLAATQQTRIAHLTSLLEVTIEDNIQQVRGNSDLRKELIQLFQSVLIERRHKI